MQETQENVQLDNDSITFQEDQLIAVRDLKEKYKNCLNKIQKIKKTKCAKISPQYGKEEYTKQKCEFFEQLLKDYNISSINQKSNLNYHLEPAVTKTQRENYIIKTEHGIYYKCKCHKREFKTYQELGGHQRKMK